LLCCRSSFWSRAFRFTLSSTLDAGPWWSPWHALSR
jgi:hypothetical protein